MTTPSYRVAMCTRTLTNWPGHSVLFSFAKRAFSLKVPLFRSMTLSIVANVPSASTVCPSRPNAVTAGAAPLASR